MASWHATVEVLDDECPPHTTAIGSCDDDKMSATPWVDLGNTTRPADWLVGTSSVAAALLPLTDHVLSENHSWISSFSVICCIFIVFLFLFLFLFPFPRRYRLGILCRILASLNPR